MVMLSENIQRVLELQGSYSPNNTPEMQERGVLIRNDLRESLVAILSKSGSDKWEVEGRDGTGLKTSVPWVRIFRREFSPSVREGFDIVFLFATDGSSVYVSLNQGTTNLVKTAFVPKSLEEIQDSTNWARNILKSNSALESKLKEMLAQASVMNLGSPTKMAASYIPGDVVHVRYVKDQIPSDEKLAEDIIGLLPLLDEIYSKEKPKEASGKIIENSSLDLMTHWSKERLEEVFDSLTDESPQIILTGPPGTGKTFVARHIAAEILGTPGDLNNPQINIVQFHPSYGYEQFIEGLQPAAADGGGFSFQNIPGEVVRIVDQIESDGKPRVLIIDEMNRANLPRVFGELMFLLEYRDSSISLMHRDSFSLPRELYIIGTMNTSDRSTRSIDIALRRRFDFFEVNPESGIMRAHYELPQNENQLGEELFSGFEKLNEMLTQRLGKHFTVGHSFFMRSNLSHKEVKKIWHHQVAPLIEEYFFSNPIETEAFALSEFFPSAK